MGIPEEQCVAKKKITPLDAELKDLWDKNIVGIIESDQAIATQLGLFKEQMEQVRRKRHH
ncbi:hypothetical protein D3C72_1411940 [compost metagenome]